MLLTVVPGDASSLLSGSTAVTISSARLISSLSTSRPRLRASRRDAARVAFVRLGRAFPPALPTLARVRLQRLSPIGNSRNPPRARKIKIINLGLEPWEAIEMGLEVEEIERGKKRRPVANYVLEGQGRERTARTLTPGSSLLTRARSRRSTF